MESTSCSSQRTSGNCRATARTSRRKSASGMLITFALCTAVTLRRRRSAISNALRAMRREACAVILRTESARSGVGMNSPRPWCMLRSE